MEADSRRRAEGSAKRPVNDAGTPTRMVGGSATGARASAPSSKDCVSPEEKGSRSGIGSVGAGIASSINLQAQELYIPSGCTRSRIGRFSVGFRKLHTQSVVHEQGFFQRKRRHSETSDRAS